MTLLETYVLGSVITSIVLLSIYLVAKKGF